MKIVELNIRLPYENRGAILSRIISKVRGRIRDIHFSPPDVRGISEVRIEVLDDNPGSLLAEIKKLIREGRLSFRVLSEA